MAGDTFGQSLHEVASSHTSSLGTTPVGSDVAERLLCALQLRRAAAVIFLDRVTGTTYWGAVGRFGGRSAGATAPRGLHAAER